MIYLIVSLLINLFILTLFIEFWMYGHMKRRQQSKRSLKRAVASSKEG